MFAPVVEACSVRTLGAGQLPEPIRPARDQLINGSLDAQYVELQGVMTSVPTNGVVLLTSEGRIKVDLHVTGLKAEQLACYEDALIRIRGCLFATWDYVTHRVNMDEIRINGADVAVEQPAPKDLFSTPRKMASELLLFDPRASVFQRVLVAGQVVHIRDPECFIMDGSSGVRFMAKHPLGLQIGDLVEAVGFPELSLAAPVLREAVARKTGHAALPKPKPLGPDELVKPDLDATLVQLKGVLVNERNTATERLLEMRVGLRSFLARLPEPKGGVQPIPAGSLLELTGTYAAQGLNQQAASFELLLNSPMDIAVLARPPWWTLERLLIILSALGCILAVTVLWITQLRRKVEERTAELATQIREREHVEQQRVMEQERTRIARDLHDELGSGLTEISMLAARARPVSANSDTRGGYLEQMGDKARQMVAALDEIVWAMNPTHDSLASMISYFSLYAERFLGLANINWRLESPFRPDDYAVDSQHRHELFLAFKEALNNVVRHSRATEVSMNIQVDQGHVCLTIMDNGRGRGAPEQTAETDGLANMRARLQKMGGRFEVNAKAGQGTVVRFDLPLD
jgi:signal transduction histidine kinase